MDSLDELHVGRFLGRYELLMPVAQGGMASVWAARLVGTRGFQKVVAIKTILPSLSEDARFEQMFLDEAALASRIRHPNVAQVLDLGEENGLLYQVMEWIDGEALNAFLRQMPDGSGMPFPIAAKIMIGACEGLHAAHELRDDQGQLVQLVHRDVSPQNILVSGDGVPKIVDFGVARANSLTSAQTQSGTLKGKPAYMAPEQIHGGDFDRRADIFSLGVVLYVLTTGKHPFRGANELATLHNICDPNPPVAPSSLREGYPKALEEVIFHALEKDPAKRTKTAAALAREIEEAVPAVHKIGDADVATFMRTLLADRLDRRAQRLRKALEEANERARQAEAEKSKASTLRTQDTFPGIGGPTPASPRIVRGSSRPSRPSSSPLARPSRPSHSPVARRSSQPGPGVPPPPRRSSAEPLPLAARKKLPPVTPPPPRPSRPSAPLGSAATLPSEYGADERVVEQEISSAVLADAPAGVPQGGSNWPRILLVVGLLGAAALGVYLFLQRSGHQRPQVQASAAQSSSGALLVPSSKQDTTSHAATGSANEDAGDGSVPVVSVESLPPARASVDEPQPGVPRWSFGKGKAGKSSDVASKSSSPGTAASSQQAPAEPSATAAQPPVSAKPQPKAPPEDDLTGTVPKIRDPGL